MSAKVSILRRFSLRYCFLLLVLTAALSACGKPASQVSVAAAMRASQGDGVFVLSQVWQRNIGGGNDFLLPTRDGEVLCTVSRAGAFSFVSVDNVADVRNSFSLPSTTMPYTAGATCGNGVAAAIDGNGLMQVHDDSGEPLWQEDLGTRVRGAPQVADGVLYVLGLDGRILAYAARRGEVLWRYVSPLKNLLRTAVDSSLLVEDGRLYAGIDNGAIVAINAVNGRVVWENGVAIARGSNAVANILDVTTPIKKGDIVCAGAYQGAIACFNADSGRLLWRRAMSVANRPAFDADGVRVFVTDLDGVIYAFAATDGEALWQRETGLDLSSPAFVPGVVVVGDGEGVLHAFYSDSGEKTAVLDLNSDKVTHLRSLAGYAEDIVGLTRRGDLFRVHVALPVR